MMNTLNCRFIGEFEKGDIIGQGTYGIVFFAKDKSTNQQVAVKKMKVMDNMDGFPITSLREVKILKMLASHPNVVSLKDVVVGNKPQNVFLVFQYCDIDLYKLMSQMLAEKIHFLEGEIKCLSLQLIKGVLYAHSKFIIHRDLKLNNLLLNKKGILKIADFGLARQYQKPNKPLTKKVVTLWYRAPQILVKIKQYSKPVDVWSVGCIIAELANNGFPLFQGNNDVHQFQMICQVIGFPIKQDWPEFYSEQKICFRKQVEKFAHLNKNKLKYIFTNATHNFIDLLKKMLKWNPSKRITLEEAIKHPYFLEEPLALFPDEIKILPKLEYYGKKSNEEYNKKKK